MMGHHVTFHASGSRVNVKWLQPPNECAAFLDAVKAAMNAKHRVPNASPNAPTAPPSPPVPPSSADEIVATLHKIGELRDGGVLTTEEFEAKKAELLSRL